MKTAKSKIVSAVMAALAVLALSACSNTFQGIGQDIEKAGEKIQSSAK